MFKNAASASDRLCFETLHCQCQLSWVAWVSSQPNIHINPLVGAIEERLCKRWMMMRKMDGAGINRPFQNPAIAKTKKSGSDPFLMDLSPQSDNLYISPKIWRLSSKSGIKSPPPRSGYVFQTLSVNKDPLRWICPSRCDLAVWWGALHIFV